MSQLSPVPADRSRPVASDQRDDLSGRLNAAYESGDLPLERYQELLGQLFDAHNVGELEPVILGLPDRYRVDTPKGASSGVDLAPGEVNEAQKKADLSSPMAKLGIGIAGALALIAILVVLLVAL